MNTNIEIIAARLRELPEAEKCFGLYAELSPELSQKERDELIDTFADCEDKLEGIAGAPTSRDLIEVRVKMLHPKSAGAKIDSVMREYDAVRDNAFAARMDKLIALKKIGYTEAQAKKRRLSLREKARDESIFYPGENPFSAELEKLMNLLVEKNKESKRLYVMAGSNVRIDVANKTVTEVNQGVLEHECNRIAVFKRFTHEDDDGVPHFKDMACPPEYSRNIYNGDQLPFPPLSRTTDLPFFDATGNLVLTPGYHKESSTYVFSAEGLSIPPVSSAPTPDEIVKARDGLLEEACGEFPFVGEASKAHLLAMLLQPAARELIAGATPLYAINKTKSRTGASFLMDVFSLINFGTSCPNTQEKASDEEMKKELLSALIAGVGVFNIDNATKVIDEPSLSSAITTGIFQGRVLGESTIVQIPVRLLFAGSPTFQVGSLRSSLPATM